MNILFFVGSFFPFGSAYASRARNLAKLLKSLGFKVHIIARYTHENVYIPGEIKEYDGITYQTLLSKPSSFDRLINPILDLHKVKKYIKSHDVDIFVTSSNPQIFIPLIRFLKKQGIPLYLEQCEWFDPLNFKLGKLDPYYKSLVKNIEKNFEKSDGIIAISSLFEEHYANKGTRAIRIPTILDTSEVNFSIQSKKNEQVLKLIFAGSIGGKKELLYPILKAIDILKENLNIEFNIYGPSVRDVLNNIDNDSLLLERLTKHVYIHGRIAQQAIDRQLRNSDFMIFLRPNRRSSNAGFPTKFAESMAVGTPVITNLTSDIGLYLNDGQNGFVVRDNSVEEMVNVLNKAVLLKESEFIMLRTNARKTAEEFFDYRKYGHLMKEFIAK